MSLDRPKVWTGTINEQALDPQPQSPIGLYDTTLRDGEQTIGVVLTTIIANTRTEELLAQSQRLTQELQVQSDELQRLPRGVKRAAGTGIDPATIADTVLQIEEHRGRCEVVVIGREAEGIECVDAA